MNVVSSNWFIESMQQQQYQYVKYVKLFAEIIKKPSQPKKNV